MLFLALQRCEKPVKQKCGTARFFSPGWRGFTVDVRRACAVERDPNIIITTKGARMSGRTAWLGCLLLLVLSGVSRVSAAAPHTAMEASAPIADATADIPPALLPWIPWVMTAHPTARCPFRHGTDLRACVWPGTLTLTLDATTGRFAQPWVMYRAGWAPLPGDVLRWPLDVSVNGRPAVVTADADGAPQVWLPAGRQQVAGSWHWPRLPDVLPLPADVGLLALQVNGAVVPFPHRDEHGQLWLQDTQRAISEEDHLDLKVFRQVRDDIPVRLTTHLVVNAAGKPREIVWPSVLPEGFLPQGVQSALPVRMDADGRLHVQVRAGNWRVTLDAYAPQSPAQITAASAGPEWPADEVWVFQANPRLRHLTLSGVETIDPQQTTLDDDWKRLPAYRVPSGAVVTLQEVQRGAPQQTDQLRLAREWWLDGDGGGFTVHDVVSGRLRSSARLEVRAPMTLGRVAADGKDQFITAFADGTHQGIEVRTGTLRVTADSRVPADAALTAVGWAHDFQSVAAHLHLPPGWRLFAATGVDSVSDSWVTRWTLLDLFLLLIVTLAAAKLWGPVWGGVALVALALTLPEPGAPQWSWVALLAAAAARRMVTAERAQWWVRRVCGVLWGFVLLHAMPFAVQQARVACYPVLEQPGHAQYVQRAETMDFKQSEHENSPEDFQGAADDMPTAKLAEPTPGAASERKQVQQMAQRVEALVMPAVLASSAQKKAALMDYRPGTNVQTGPGLPRWQWRTVQLRWSGPVPADQALRFYWWSPGVNGALAVARIIGLALLLAVTLGAARWRWPAWLHPRTGAVVLLLGLALIPAPAHSADGETTTLLPSDALLQALQTRLLQPPLCAPSGCADIAHAHLEAGAQSLRITVVAHAAAVTAIPLPGSAQEWHATHVTIDGAPAGVVQGEDGQYWAALDPGVHRITMEGPLDGAIRVALPLKPHRVTVALPGWTISGIRADGGVDDSLELVSTAPARGAAGGDGRNGQAGAGNVPPHVRIERTLRLGLEWSVETRVVRETPLGTAIGFDVPLLPGESVTSSDIQVAGGVARITMGPQIESIAWDAVLPEADVVELRAAVTSGSHEVWVVDASPVWHIETAGIPPTPHNDAADDRLTWHPWPGETVTLRVTRPDGVAGQTLTVDYSTLTATPGRRLGEYRLEYALRSSLGGQQTVTLPDGAVAQALAIDGVEQPLRQDGRRVTVPLVPGAQLVMLAWREPQGIRMWYRVPRVDLGVPSVNAQTDVEVPANRWTLLVGGPRIGPAVVFWGYLAIMFLCAVALSRLPWVPLRLSHWLLLGLGLSQAPTESALLIVGVFVALGWRQHAVRASLRGFNLLQLGLAFWVVLAVCALLEVIQAGLLGAPQMQILGNGSTAQALRWMQDRTDTTLPTPWVLSVSLWWYRLAMLGWALWLAWALVRWAQWAWGCMTAGGAWLPRAKKPAPPHTA